MSRIVWHEVIYRCDDKNCSEELILAEEPAQANREAKRVGWVVKRDKTCYCPKCKKIR